MARQGGNGVGRREGAEDKVRVRKRKKRDEKREGRRKGWGRGRIREEKTGMGGGLKGWERKGAGTGEG